MLCKVSNATRILSKIKRVLVKALWCSIIMDGKILFNLFAITLENILQKTLHRLIGRQSVTAKWFFVFGIRVINV